VSRLTGQIKARTITVKGRSVAVVVLSGVLLLVVLGCVCVFRDARGDGPRWVHVVAVVTLAAGEVVSRSGKRGRRGSGGGGDDD
jgi:hypothetical protein